jgi:hypothetical protein
LTMAVPSEEKDYENQNSKENSSEDEWFLSE